MAISIYNLFEAILLVVNAIAVLNEERFLAKIGWARNQQNVPAYGYGGQQGDTGIKSNIINLIHSIRTVMRFPLILINVITIVFKLVIG